MAVTSIWKVEGRLARVLGYAGNPDKAEGSPDEWELQGVGAAILYAADPGKTERQLYVTGVNCLPATALEEMNATKRQYGKTGGIVAFHGYQAFAPGETDPATAHEVGVALAQELWGGRFEVVVATHLDKAHLHNHFVVNSVSFADGRRFHRDAACYRAMREASDELCREHGLSVVESPGRGGARHHAEWRAEREGRPTWRSLVKADVDEAVGRAASMRQFHANLRAMGYDVKVGKDISVRPPGKERFVRLRRNFGDAYSQEGIGARRALRRGQQVGERLRPVVFAVEAHCCAICLKHLFGYFVIKQFGNVIPRQKQPVFMIVYLMIQQYLWCFCYHLRQGTENIFHFVGDKLGADIASEYNRGFLGIVWATVRKLSQNLYSSK